MKRYFTKLLSNLSIITLEIVLIIACVKTFSHTYSPLAGTLLITGILISIYVMIVWVQNRYLRWARPGLVKTTLFVLAIIIIATFAGVQPMSSWKDKVVDYFRELEIKAPIQESSLITPTIDSKAITLTPTITVKPEPKLQNPSWDQLTTFLLSDKTDELPYIYPSFVCQDFAETIQNNANKAGWRCALVTLDMTGYTDPYNLGIAQDAGHACNAFETTDKGLIFIDCTGNIPGTMHPINSDATVIVKIGEKYIPQYIFPIGGWYFEDMGIVTGYHLSW